MTPQKRAEKKAKLLRMASDLRGNENERMIAERSYRKLCENPRQTSDRPEFNRVERAVIGLGTVVFFGAVLFADLVKARKERRRRGPLTASTA